MTVLRTRDVRAALTAKGMEPADAHHKMFSKTHDGLITLKTRVSHGSTTIGDELISRMAKQCALRTAEFVALIECTLSQEAWEALVSERCVGGRNPYLPNR